MNVSIVTYHTDLDELALCLRSLDSDCVEKIWIIDNASDEGLRLFCLGKSKIVYIPSSNDGYGAGHNKAIALSIDNGSDYHLVLNSDIEFESEILRKAINFMDVHEDVALLHPCLTYPDGCPQYTARLLPTPLDVFARRFLPGFLFGKRNRRYTLQFVDRNKTIDVPYVQGSFMLLRCNALKEVGLFDTRFFMYPEDIDLTRRLHKRHKTLYWPEIRAVHKHKAASYRNARMLRIHIVNMIRYFNKWGWFFDRERRRINRELLQILSNQGYKP